MFWNTSSPLGLATPRKSKSTIVTPLEARMEMIARPTAGKTTMLTAINEVCEGAHLPSGLWFGVDDPLKSNEILQRLHQRREELHTEVGPSSTQDDYELEYCLEEGEESRVKFVTHEVIGQVLTGTTPDSTPAQRTLYDRYLKKLGSANALVPMIAVPQGDADPHSRSQFKEDLRLTNAYLRQALKLHAADTPCVVAIVVTKIDTLFPTEKQARQTLTNDVLREALAPLVQTVAASEKVREAVIVPTSSLGFGRSEEVDGDEGNSNHRGPLHRLVGEELDPFNVTGLLVWLLLNGLTPQSIPMGDHETVFGRVVQMLADDLDALAPWLMPIKKRGRVVG